ncbi:MAG: RNA methyltransferase, partial [candidate division WOR-3 bacterium]
NSGYVLDSGFGCGTIIVMKPKTRGEPLRPGRSLKGHVAPDGIETFYEVRSRDSDLSPDEFRRLPRRPVHIVLDNLRSAFNVGSIFRLADAVRAAEVVCCGYTCHPPHHKLEHTALGTTESVPWRHVAGTTEAISDLRSRGIQVIALETASPARPFHEFAFQPPAALVLGNEALGVSQAVLALCDAVVEIPVFGFKNSINVAAAVAIVLYELARRYGWLDRGPSPPAGTGECTR